MIKHILHFVLFALIGLGLTGFKHLQTTASNPANEMLILVNEARSQTQICGTEALSPVGPVTLNQQLNQAALVHSNDMASNNFLSHMGLNGSSFDQRIEAQGYVFGFAGENVAAGKSTAQETITQWLNSEGHCRNIMSANFTEMGVGVSENPTSTYKVYWAQVFATPFGNSGSSDSSGSSAENSNVVISTPTTNSGQNPTALQNSPTSTITPIPTPTVNLTTTNDTNASETTTNQPATNTATNTTPSSQQSETSDNLSNSQTDSLVSQNFALELLTLINQARSKTQNCGGEAFPAVAALSLNESLMQAAQGHSSSMAENNFFGQAGLDGKNFDKRAEAQGYSFSSIAENIIAGRPTIADVMGSLLENDGYCRGLMSSDYTELGIGFGENPNSQYRFYWTLTFAKPR